MKTDINSECCVIHFNDRVAHNENYEIKDLE